MTKRKKPKRLTRTIVMSRPPGDPSHLVALPPVLVAGRWYTRHVSTGPGLPQVVTIPGVAATDSLPEIPERMLRFTGYAPTVTLAVRQMNAVADAPGAGRPEVQGQTRFSVAFDDVLVYIPSFTFPTLLEALVAAGEAVRRLLAHPVNWLDPTAWQGLSVLWRGQRGRVVAYEPTRGECQVRLSGGEQVRVDITSESVLWGIPDEPGAEPTTTDEPGASAPSAVVPDRSREAEPEL